MPSKLPYPISFNVYRGDDFRRLFRVYDTDGQPKDLTGYLIDGQVRDGDSPTAPLLATLTFERDDASGIFTAVLSDTVTAGISLAEGNYDIRMTDTDGNRLTWFKGKLYFKNAVTA